MAVGDWIARNRKKLGINQAQLGERLRNLSVGQTTISKWETGKSEPSLDELDRLSEVFGVRYSTSEIVGESVVYVMVPVMGNVGARQRVDMLNGDSVEHIEGPPGAPASAQCVIVRGGHHPTFKDGTALLWWTWVEDPSLHLGEVCIIELEDGTTYVREVARGSRPGLWTLRAPESAPIDDVRIKKLALIEMSWRRPQWINQTSGG